MHAAVPALISVLALIAAPLQAAPARGKPGKAEKGATAAPAAAPDPAVMARFELGFTEGQALFDRGDLLGAARRWIAAAELLPETTTHRDQRAGIYEYIVDAFVRGIQDGGSLQDLREAAAAIDGYCEGYTRAYGTETPLNPKVAAARMELKSRLVAAEEKAAQSSVARPRPVEAIEPSGPAPMPAPTPTGKPWKPLVITGAVLTGVGGLALLAAVYGGVSGIGLTRDYDTTCTVDDPSTACQDLLTKGKAANGLAVSGAVLGVLLVGAGVPLLVVGMKRKQQGRTQALRPLLAPGFVGLGLRGRF